MAKLIGNVQFIGKLRNDVGFRGQDGQILLRINTKPSNPNTTLQQQTRAKFNLAAQLSKITPTSLIEGLSGGTKRKRRARFSSLIMQNSFASYIDESNPHYYAQLIAEQLTFSEGPSYTIKEDIILKFNETDKTFDITISGDNFKWHDGQLDGAILVAVKMSNASGVLQYTKTETILLNRVNTSNSGINNKFSFDAANTTTANIYFIPFVFNNETARTAYDNYLVGGDVIDNRIQDYTVTYLTRFGQSNYKYMQSQFLGKIST